MRKLIVLIALVALAVAAFGTAQAGAARPNTQIHLISKTSSTAKFHMIALKSGSLCRRCKIQCKVDGRSWRTCVSSGGQGYWTFKNLSRGSHTARARAVDAAGLRDLTPAYKTFTI
jgi:hypothetical protein